MARSIVDINWNYAGDAIRKYCCRLSEMTCVDLDSGLCHTYHDAFLIFHCLWSYCVSAVID